MNRRTFVLGGLAAVAGTALGGASPGSAQPGSAAAVAARTRGAGVQAIRFPFELGVASGDPAPTASCCGPGSPRRR